MAEKVKVEATEKKERKIDEGLDAFMDHQRKAFEEAGKALEGLVPTAFREHGQSAFKEAVEGYRRLFNSVLDEIVATVEKAKMNEDDKK